MSSLSHQIPPRRNSLLSLLIRIEQRTVRTISTNRRSLNFELTSSDQEITIDMYGVRLYLRKMYAALLKYIRNANDWTLTISSLGFITMVCPFILFSCVKYIPCLNTDIIPHRRHVKFFPLFVVCLVSSIFLEYEERRLADATLCEIQ